MKYVSGCDSISFGCLQEQGDLLHLLKGHLRLWNLLDRLLPPWIEAVDEPTEDLEQKLLFLDVKFVNNLEHFQGELLSRERLIIGLKVLYF